MLYSEEKCKELDRVWNSIPGVEMLQGKTILVAGATGTIGAYIVDVLRYANQYKNAKVRILALSRKLQSLVDVFGEECEKLKFLEQDINEYFELEEKVDYIIHAAGNAHPRSFQMDPSGTILNAVNGTRNLLELARCKSAKLLYLSSGEVYGGGNARGDWEETDRIEINPSLWRACYPMGKSVAENLCVCYGMQFNVSFMIARLCHTFGASITKSDNRACAQFLCNAAKGEDICLLSEGLNLRSYIYVGDAVAALLSLLSNGEAGQVYNVAGDEAVTIREFAQICAQKGNVQVVQQIPTEQQKNAQTYIERQILNNNKLKSSGWKPVFTIEEGIELVVRELQKGMSN